jgi:hypothetical protein
MKDVEETGRKQERLMELISDHGCWWRLVLMVLNLLVMLT